MSVTATELKLNLGKYLKLAQSEDVLVTKNGKVVVKLTNPNQDRMDIVNSLYGMLSADTSLEDARLERLRGL